ncbi:Tim44/TimA family putative adaptor protein [Paracoccus sulfuroxidans]|uniref:Putative lipid-binding transport protein (Tim44 family) n=1 Tax=Paracoccus sulfuroxidans TaxID=384678 RepID=A0A562NM91_9RHOB|nr:Tim44/TimA family putative adaptor protein [Paracoccus sulfuroxidans]TWI33337.1 putative lipid-binding transport protein (Tim44 family) [Paracoccus sulfuroxidans]
MSNSMLQLLVLGAIAVFLILRLRGVLGTRDGYEPPRPQPEPIERKRFDTIDGTAEQGDSDISDHAEKGSPAASALAEMKRAEPSFAVGPFLSGAKSAYEMILMAFERGELDEVRGFLSPEVAQAFDSVIADRKARGLTTTAQYLGTRETALAGAEFNRDTRTAEISVRFVGEMIVATRDAEGNVVDGDAKSPRKQRDTWTFARQMGQNDPNWQLVATA